MSAPDLLDVLKEDLGITGAEQDEWIKRRVEGIWARIESYTSRRLCVPPQQFIDDWTLVAGVDVHWNVPPAIAYWPRTTTFLRYFPVVSVDAIDQSGNTVDPAGARFNARTGRLLSLTAPQNLAHDLSRELLGTTRITYTSGWDECPPDLYEIVLGVMQVMWGQRSAQSGGASGGDLGQVSGVNLVDVGSVEIATPTSFLDSTAKTGGNSDPLLGPYLTMLDDSWVDQRVNNQWAPVTIDVPPEPEPIP